MTDKVMENQRELERIRALSKEGMRNIFDFVQRTAKAGIDTELPYNEVQNAKEYYWYWYKERGMGFRNFAWLGLVAVFGMVGFVYLGEYEVIPLLFLFVWLFVLGITQMRRKEDYIMEMLGNTSHLPRKKQKYYLQGMLEDMFGISKTIVHWKRGIYTYLGASLPFVATEYGYLTIFNDEELMAIAVFFIIVFFAYKPFTVKGRSK